MRLLLDNNLSPRLADRLTGHDVVHIRALGLAAGSDESVLGRAHEDGRVLVSADTDFGRLLAMSQERGPSVVLLRRQGPRRVDALAALLRANLPLVEDDLDQGALVVIGGDDIRIRKLPILRGS